MKIYQNKSDKSIADWLNRMWFVREYKSWRTGEATSKRLSEMRRNPFYYWMYHRWDSMIDLTEEWINPYFEPMISFEEHQILVDRYQKKTWYRAYKSRKDENDCITPFEKQTIITKDWYSLSPYTPNPWRFRKKLAKLQQTEPDATLADVVESHQISCRCSADQSKFKWLAINYDKIESKLQKSLNKMKMTEEVYQIYLKDSKVRLAKEKEDIKLELSRLQLALNKVRSEKNRYIDRNMWQAQDDEEREIYNRKKLKFQNQINWITNDIKELTENERDTEMEFEYMLDLLKNAWQLFWEANYVQKRMITKLFVSNIVIISEKQLEINYKPWLTRFFWSNLEMTGLEPVSESHGM